MFLYSWVIDSLNIQFYKGTKELSFLSESIPYKKTCGFLSENEIGYTPPWAENKNKSDCFY
jgi:hypothetical protein